MTPTASTAGYTLLQMMVTLAVAAILAAVALPSYSEVVARNRVTAAGNDLIAALQFARHEAMRRNAPVQVCGSSDGQACAGGTWQHWIVRTGAGQILRSGQVPESVAANAAGAFSTGLQFDAAGLFHAVGNRTQEGRLELCSARAEHRLEVEARGGVQLRLVPGMPGRCA